MRKTVNVNIGSLPFTMDDNAYQTLNDYLNDIEARLGADDHGSMSNIELRIARLFDSRLNEARQVIDLAMVKEAMALIGTPASFGQLRTESRHYDEDAEVVTTTHHAPKQPTEVVVHADDTECKVQSAIVAHDERNLPAQPIATREPYDYPSHLYRSRDERMIAGVCGGIAKYTNIPVSKLRVVALVLILVAGLTLIAYFIMWYIVPEEPLYDINGNVIDTTKSNNETRED